MRIGVHFQEIIGRGNSPFLKELREHITVEQTAIKSALASLHILGLKTPESGEFIVGSSCLLLFLNQYGLVLRFSKNTKTGTPPDHPLILRPIWAMNEKDIRIELLPGITPAGDSELAHRLSLRLEQDGIIFDDNKGENVGYIRPIGAKPIPLVLDRGAVNSGEGVKRLKPGFRNVSQLKNLSPNDPQNIYFSDLYRLAYSCLPKTAKGWSKAVDSSDMHHIRVFLDFCSQEIQKFENGNESLLENNWSGSRFISKPIPKGLQGEVSGQKYRCSNLVNL